MELISLSWSQLPALRDLYKQDWPLHCSTFSTIDLFIERIEKHPEWKEIVSFVALDDAPDATFLMSYENRVFFNSLEASPYTKLRKMLLAYELNDKVQFVNIRDALRPLLLDVIRIQHFDVVTDVGTRSYFFDKDDLLFFKDDIHPPDNLKFKPLTVQHAAKINSLWPGKHEGSERYLSNLITYNMSFGLFDENDDLIAWTTRLDNGSMGVGQVDIGRDGHRFGTITIFAFAVEIAKKYNRDVHFEVVNGNKPHTFLKSMGIRMIDTQSWIAVKRKAKLETTNLWGHL